MKTCFGQQKHIHELYNTELTRLEDGEQNSQRGEGGLLGAKEQGS